MKKLFLFAPALLLMACGGETESTSEDTNTETVEETQPVVEEIVEEVAAPEVMYQTDDHAEEEILAYLEEKGWEGEKHESGMYIVFDNPGEGEERPNLLDEVTIFYEGFLLDGTRFDGTTDAPATFPLMQLIQGWQIGIPHFGKGGKGKLVIPSGLAYGDRDNGDIPGGSTLMFEIELVDWRPAM